MSVATLGKLAAVRDTQAVTRDDVAKGEPNDSGDPAKVRDLVATLIPTEIIAAYSALLAVILEYMDGQRNEGKDPGDYASLRWGLIVGLLVFTGYFVLMAYRKRRTASTKRFPAIEVSVACLAAAAWGLSGPGTPVSLAFDGLPAIFVPNAILFVVFLILLPLVPKLRTKAT